jgi:methionyl-tRNA formyltransferase
MNNTQDKIEYIYFSTGFFGEDVLKNLIKINLIPKLIITSIDKPIGRHQIIQDGPIKKIAIENNISYIQVDNMKDDKFISDFNKYIDEKTLCVVCDYGKILSDNFLNSNVLDFINIHPSLLPLYRGPAPLQNTILNNDRNTGVTIIKMDKYMDHGPIISQIEKSIDENIWPCSIYELSQILSIEASNMLKDLIYKYQNNDIFYMEQNHDMATYTKMIKKTDAQVFIDKENIHQIYIKYQAYKHWPEIFYINNDNKRVKIKKMNKDKIERIIIEGKAESDFIDFQ